MTVPSFWPVHQDEQNRAFATLVLAFANDPIERWLYPEPEQYLTHFPAFLSAFGGGAFEHQTVWRLDAFSAIAVWLPPGAEPDGEAIVTTLTQSVHPARHADMFSVLHQMEKTHPKYPHWYLPWFGVDSAMQAKGLGGRLLRSCLEVVDATDSPAYLETPNPRNICFYERHGFDVIGVAQAGACPPVTSMLRAES